MFLKNIKNIIKKNFPIIANQLISFRDNNKFLRFFSSQNKININKNVHGKRIVNINKKNSNNDVFFSYTFRPISEINTYKNIIFNHHSKDTAIIIQGPVANYENFVIDTIKIYLKIFPETLLILSTWEDEVDESFLMKVNSFKNFKLILNKKITTKYNVNLQIISTSSALNYAAKNNYKYSLKTRTDCRLYNPYSLVFLKSLIETFKTNNPQNQKGRILSASTDTRIYRIYGLSDICLYSKTEDLEKYFNNENYEDSLRKLNIDINNPIIKQTAVINEIFLCSRYLKNINLELDWTLDDWWKKCRDVFCVFDTKSLDLFWYKYHWQYEQRFINNYTSEFNQSLQFSDWINIFNSRTEFYNKSFKEKWYLNNGFPEQTN